MQQYLNLKIGAKRRLEILRQSAKTGKWVQPMTWKNCRFGTFKNQHSLDWSGDSWYTFEPGALSRQRYADEICKSIGHAGWFTDSHCEGKARGIVVNLPHGRFIAGYEWSDNGEVVYYPETFEDAREAARSADYHAEKFAESQREDSERFDEFQRLENLIEDSLQRRKECLILARVGCDKDARREEARELRETIIAARQTIADDYSEF